MPPTIEHLWSAAAGQNVVSQFAPTLLRGLYTTLRLTAVCTVVMVGVSLVVGLGLLSGSRLVRGVCRTYVEIFRGTSAIVQLFYWYFVLPLLGVSISPFLAAVFALGLNVGSFGSEIVRASVRAVDRGQWEAARSIHLSPLRTLVRVILPQALPRMVPPFTNLIVELLKATSLVSLITISDLAFQAQSLQQTFGRPTQVYALTLLFYFMVCYPLTLAARGFEVRLRRTSGLNNQK